jgi:glycolate dehydrogenase iron-sulfur subunit
VVRTLGLTRWLPRRLRLLEELLPAPVTPVRAPSRSGTGPRVVFLRTCMMDVALPNVDRATRIVLQRNAGSVAETRAHGCCGALHLHAGRRDEARTLARRTIRAAETARGDVYVTNSAGCGAAMKEYAHLLADDDAWRERAAAFSARVVDVTEYLADHGLELPADAERRESARVVYQDACHLAHGQRVRSAPRVLLRSTPSVDLVDLPHSDWCCGSGGIYNVLQPDWSDAVLADKIATIRRTGAEVVAVANPGCLLHIGRGLRSAGLRTRTAHPVELLAEAYVRAETPRRMHEPRNHWPGEPVQPVSVDESPVRRDAADS